MNDFNVTVPRELRIRGFTRIAVISAFPKFQKILESKYDCDKVIIAVNLSEDRTYRFLYFKELHRKEFIGGSHGESGGHSSLKVFLDFDFCRETAIEFVEILSSFNLCRKNVKLKTGMIVEKLIGFSESDLRDVINRDKYFQIIGPDSLVG